MYVLELTPCENKKSTINVVDLWHQTLCNVCCSLCAVRVIVFFSMYVVSLCLSVSLSYCYMFIFSTNNILW